jgi:LysM repeat protein
MRLARTILLLAILLYLFGTAPRAAAQGPCGETYVVQPGDTLGSIAAFCETTVDALRAANPGITDPTRLFVGQRLNIPSPEEPAAQPLVSIFPDCGSPATEVRVVGSSFPSNAIIELEIGEQFAPAVDFDQVERLRANANGRFETVETIPRTARPNENWIIVAIARTGGPRLEVASNPFFVTSEAPRGATTTYIVQPGDTLRSIASRLDTTISALIEANPEITDPSLIYVGQRLIVPSPAEGDPTVAISPTCGPAGSEVEVVVSDFPPNARVTISAGIFRGEQEVVARDITDGQGQLETEVTIPETARRNEPWVVIVETVDEPRIRSSSNIFTVSRAAGAGVATTYIVQPGDMLIDIAARFRVSTQTLLSANPDIANPNQLIVGQRLRIPGQVEAVTITPTSGPPGTELRVEATNFPGNTRIEIGVGKSSTDFEVVETGLTGDNGNFTTQVSIPINARPNERWLVVAIARPGRFEIRATSGFFTVTSQEPAEGALVTIWPQEGPPGSTFFIVGAGFPEYTPVEIRLGRVGESLEVVESTVTDINGTLSSQLSIPETAETNQGWVAVIATTQAPAVEATSPAFVVTR